MSKTGAIILVDDDTDECELIQQAFTGLNVGNQLVCFTNGQEALDYLRQVPEAPFLILSDVNMPVMDGMELRRQIELDETLKKKSIPFIFITTTAAPMAVREAYELSVQGFFQKGQTVEEIKQLLQDIYLYWQRCKHPLG